VSGGGQPIEAIILAHGKHPALGTWSVVGAERHLKSSWGGAKKTEENLFENVFA
jgi:hypothetical protein